MSAGDMLSPNADTEVNERGGKQSRASMRFDLLDAESMMKLAGICARGAEKYGVDNWRKIDTADHINHALAHMYAYLAGDRQDDHLGHALARSLMADATARELNCPIQEAVSSAGGKKE